MSTRYGFAVDEIISKTPGGGVTVAGLLLQNGVVSNLNNVSNIKTNSTATSAPTVNDDSGLDYSVCSIWTNTTNDMSYICTDATSGAAVWKKISANGPVYYTVSSLGESSTTSSSYIQKLQFSQAIPAGNYLIMWSCGIYSDDEKINLRIRVDGSTIFETQGAKVRDGYTAYSGHEITTLTAASHTVDIYYSEESLGTTFIKYARISLIQLYE